MCSTEEDNAAQLRVFCSGKSYQYRQVALSIWAEDTQSGGRVYWDTGCAIFQDTFWLENKFLGLFYSL